MVIECSRSLCLRFYLSIISVYLGILIELQPTQQCNEPMQMLCVCEYCRVHNNTLFLLKQYDLWVSTESVLDRDAIAAMVKCIACSSFPHIQTHLYIYIYISCYLFCSAYFCFTCSVQWQLAIARALWTISVSDDPYSIYGLHRVFSVFSYFFFSLPDTACCWWTSTTMLWSSDGCAGHSPNKPSDGDHVCTGAHTFW